MTTANGYTEFNGTSYHKDTDKRVIDVLEKLRQNGRDTRIRIFYGDTMNGMCWFEEFEVMGYVGRTGGAMKSPILMYSKRSRGGGLITTESIVKITDTKGKPFYSHPFFHVPELSVFDLREVETVTDGFPWRITTPDDVIAHCATEGEAERLVDFYKGVRFSK